jgi:mannose/fructose/N-acetylgalactosamine-specific phosphotransferase system component IID
MSKHQETEDYDDLMIESKTDLAGILAGISDSQRIAAVRRILATIEEEGTIEQIRSEINHQGYDD